MSMQLKVAKYGARRGAQGDFLGLGGLLGGIGKIAQKVGGFVPVVGGTVSKIGGVLAGIGGSKQRPPAALPGGASINPTAITRMLPDSVVVKGRGITTPIGSAGSGSATAYFSNGRPRKRIRRINPLNPKALKRSISRIGKFADFAKQCGFTRPPAKLKGVRAPKRRRAAACR